MGGKWPTEPLVPASPNLVSLPSCPWGASVLSFSQLFPLPFVLFLSALSLSFCPFPSPEVFLLLSLSSLQPCSSEGAWTSGSYSISPLSLQGRVSSSWQWLTLMGDEPRGGRGSPHSIQTLAQQTLPDLRFMSMIEVQTSYHVAAGSPTVPVFSPLFLVTQRCSTGDGLKWQISIYWYMHRWVSTFGFHSQRQCTTVWFLGLITLVGSGQDARSFTGPFWKHTGWYLNRYPQGMGWNVNLSLSLFQSFLSLLPWSSHLHSCPLYPKNFLSVSLSFVIGIFVCDVVLSVQLLLLVYADIAGTVEHLSLEIKHSAHCLRLQPWVT